MDKESYVNFLVRPSVSLLVAGVFLVLSALTALLKRRRPTPFGLLLMLTGPVLMIFETAGLRLFGGSTAYIASMLIYSCTAPSTLWTTFKGLWTPGEELLESDGSAQRNEGVTKERK